MTVAGRAECARVVREFVSGVLGSGHRCRENAILLVNREVFGNSVRHSRSGERGGTATVAATVGGGVIRVEVADRSGAGIPQLCSASGGAEGGRRLGLVAALAARWGWRCGGRTVTWFELCGSADVPDVYLGCTCAVYGASGKRGVRRLYG